MQWHSFLSSAEHRLFIQADNGTIDSVRADDRNGTEKRCPQIFVWLPNWQLRREKTPRREIGLIRRANDGGVSRDKKIQESYLADCTRCVFCSRNLRLQWTSTQMWTLAIGMTTKNNCQRLYFSDWSNDNKPSMKVGKSSYQMQKGLSTGHDWRTRTARLMGLLERLRCWKEQFILDIGEILQAHRTNQKLRPCGNILSPNGIALNKEGMVLHTGW